MGVLRDALRRPVAGLPLRERVGRARRWRSRCATGPAPAPGPMIPAVLEELEGIVPSTTSRARRHRHHRGNTDAEIGRCSATRSSTACGWSTMTRATTALVWSGGTGAAYPSCSTGTGSRPTSDHDRIRRAALLRRLQRRPQARRPGPRRSGDRADPARRHAHRRPAGDWGVFEGNPVHDDIRAVVDAVGRVDFGAGRGAQPRAADRRGVRRTAAGDARRRPGVAQRLAMQPVPALFDVVVTTNAGYPLDQNLYQAVKGMSAGMRSCGRAARSSAPPSAGRFPDHGSFREVLASEPSPRRCWRDRVP